MARNSQGIYTLPAGNPVQADTVIESDNWANPTLEDIGAEITDSLSRDGKGSMRSELGIVNGLESNPGLRFNAETGSGMYREGSGEWGLARIGTLFLRLGAAGLTAAKTFICSTPEDVVQAIVRGNDPQTENLHEWQDHTGAILSYIDSTGKFFGAIEKGNPTGSVTAFAGTGTPAGWLFCDGAAVSRTTFADLFTAIGIIYGAGNGTTTFNVPDYRGQFLRGQDAGAGVDPDAAGRTDRGDGTGGDNVGSKQAEDTLAHLHGNTPVDSGAASSNHTHDGGSLTATAVADHTHLYQGVTGGGLSGGGGGAGGNKATGGGGAHSHTITGSTGFFSDDHVHNVPLVDTDLAGGNETRPVNTYTRYIIKVT